MTLQWASVCPQGAEGMVGEVALNHHRDALPLKRLIEELDCVDQREEKAKCTTPGKRGRIFLYNVIKKHYQPPILSCFLLRFVHLVNSGYDMGLLEILHKFCDFFKSHFGPHLETHSWPRLIGLCGWVCDAGLFHINYIMVQSGFFFFFFFLSINLVNNPSTTPQRKAQEDFSLLLNNPKHPPPRLNLA